jgi:hypothetical protein
MKWYKHDINKKTKSAPTYFATFSTHKSKDCKSSVSITRNNCSSPTRQIMLDYGRPGGRPLGKIQILISKNKIQTTFEK